MGKSGYSYVPSRLLLFRPGKTRCWAQTPPMLGDESSTAREWFPCRTKYCLAAASPYQPGRTATQWGQQYSSRQGRDRRMRRDVPAPITTQSSVSIIVAIHASMVNRPSASMHQNHVYRPGLSRRVRLSGFPTRLHMAHGGAVSYIPPPVFPAVTRTLLVGLGGMGCQARPCNTQCNVRWEFSTSAPCLAMPRYFWESD